MCKKIFKREIDKIKNTIKHCYVNAPNYEKIKNLVFENIKPGLNISKLNINLINIICNYLNINTKMYISSEIEKLGKDVFLELIQQLEIISKSLKTVLLERVL